MKSMKTILFASVMAFAATAAFADKYDDAVANFKTSPKAKSFFANSYAYAVFPDVGKAGFIVGGEHGDGKVYEQGKPVGTASLTQISVGAQAGAKEYSEVIFFQTKADFDKFRAGEFQLSGNAEATAITLNASASAGTDSSTATAGTEADTSKTAGGYQNGVAVFTVTKGGLMAGISVGGQKLKFKPAK
jgi:lipid-binding SYLF domain-containing protein